MITEITSILKIFAAFIVIKGTPPFSKSLATAKPTAVAKGQYTFLIQPMTPISSC